MLRAEWWDEVRRMTGGALKACPLRRKTTDASCATPGLRRSDVAVFFEFDRGFEARSGFFQLHDGGIDGGDEKFSVEFVAFADDIDVLPFSDEGFPTT